MLSAIPHKIWIKGRTWYRVVWVDRFDDPAQYGECWKEAKQIALLNGMSDRKNVEALIHEICHAIEYEYSVPIPHKIIETLERVTLKILDKNGWIPKA